MSSQQDPLKLLIRALSGGKEIQLFADDRTTRVYEIQQSDFIGFPMVGSERLLLPKGTLTRYKKDDTYYDIQSLLLCVQAKDDGVGEYLSKAMAANVGFAPTTDRQGVIDLLLGRREPGPEIDPLPEEVATDGQGGKDGERPAKKARYQVNKEDQELVKKIYSFQEVKPLLDRDSILRGVKPNNFEFVRSLVSDRLKGFKDDLERQDRNVVSASYSSTSTSDRKKRTQHPIIIVSPSSSALITMSNIKRFLEDGVFEAASTTATGDDVTTVYHRRQIGSLSAAQLVAAQSGASGLGSTSLGAGERQARYYVVDSVEALSKFGQDAWDRVVCVMTTGQEWQFRPYKWSEPKELFHHVKGIYFGQKSDAPNLKIKSWNVTELKIDPTKRYLDKSVVAEFWNVLESWISINKPSVAW